MNHKKMTTRKRIQEPEFTNRFTGEELSTYPTPFADLSKKTSHRTKNANKLKTQIEKFKGTYTCPLCGENREWIPDTNVMVCKNESCPGIKITKRTKDGKEIEITYPSYRTLYPLGEKIAETLLG